MKLLVDAQLPMRLVEALRGLGHDVLHTSELPAGNRTTDSEIIRIADSDERIVVTKDSDFLDAHLLSTTPRRLLVVATGNIGNDELIERFEDVVVALGVAFADVSLVQLSRDALVLHD
jgi:predicted nuclease of predicted toxin-antitoxin system